jgi:alpha-tubulin suppressor-like RCC1 family protein
MRPLRSLSRLAGALAALPLSLAAADLSAGGYHVVRVDAGLVKGLGDGTYGQLGAEPSGTPATVAGLRGVTHVSAGGFSTLALKSDGTVWFLGESILQHTTPHGTPMAASTPVQVAGLSGIDAIAAGHRHFLALDADTGDLYAWGHNGSGQVGNDSLRDAATPVLVLDNVTGMSAGDGFSLAVKTDNTVWSWGRNTHGQLGLGDTADRLAPTQVTGITTAAAVAAGGQHALVLLSGGSVLSMGHNGFGQLGLGHGTATSTPTPVPALAGITQVAAGYHHSAALGPAGQVHTWGRNFEGQCGGENGSPVIRHSPHLLVGLPASPTKLTCGYHFTVLELADGSLAGTGSNTDGQLDGTSVADQDDSRKILSPQLIPLAPDRTPPSPDPMSFASPPTAFDASTITMTATVASDLSGPAEYFFHCATPGGHDSGWQTAPGYTDTGLVTGTSYTYQVKARDAAGNETALSPPASAIAMADTTPPTPDPMTFAVPPTAIGAGSMTMTATTASDPNGVEYFFENTAGGGHDSGWQDSPVHLDTGLAPGTRFSYRVRARDKSAARNTTAFSAASSATTGVIQVILSTDFTGRTVSGKTASGIPWTVGGVQDPGDLTWVLEGGGPAGTSLFDTANAQGHFAPDLNIGNEGPWSVMIPLTLTIPQLQVDDVVLDWQHFNNSGDFQTEDRSADWTIRATGSTSGLIGSVTTANVNAISGVETLAFTPPLVLTNAETYQLKISVTGSNPTGNNTGLSGLTINGAAGDPPDNFGDWIANPDFGLDPGDRDFGDDPDGDRLANGLESWLGTHPNDFNPGLTGLASDGTRTILTHPRNENPPGDVSGFYEWSLDLIEWFAGDGMDGPPAGPTVTITAGINGASTIVTATTSEIRGLLFLRLGVRQD